MVQNWILNYGKDTSLKIPLAAGIFYTALQNTPATTRVLLPDRHGLASQLSQKSQLEEMLSRAAEPLEQMMNNAVHYLMTDMPSFVRFVAGGFRIGVDWGNQS